MSVYEGQEKETGTPCVSVTPGRNKEQWGPLEPFHVEVVCGDSPPHITMVVKRSPGTIEDVAVGLGRIASGLARVDTREEVKEHLRGGGKRHLERARSRVTFVRLAASAAALSGVIAAGAGVLSMDSPEKESTLNRPVVALPGAQGDMAVANVIDSTWMTSVAEAALTAPEPIEDLPLVVFFPPDAILAPMPKPWSWQLRNPETCVGAKKKFIEGGCWREFNDDPPCPESYLHGDKCWIPVAAPGQKPPKTIPHVAGPAR
ncbi:hypothetical protein LXT21_42355 [Myxococcus sp. K38C18041901]|uniref:hypothetical protein n=1 Tax=Myxococcus guangdongensis TaxID=2906760 RepID=UPI0020A7C60E|nr:hypothetical protein [Myxococcus guangdongensis]MCP3065427.1 hypothetical protein [Myxococcus guangdongensis]